MAEMKARELPQVERPLSPHLQIYSPLINMVMSILHRITGGALYFGTLLLAWWLLAAASGPEHFETANWFFSSIIGKLVLFGYTWALIHHALGGIRLLVFDYDRGTRAMAAAGERVGLRWRPADLMIFPGNAREQGEHP